MINDVGIIGGGYIGTVIGAVLAKRGAHITIVENNQKHLTNLISGTVEFNEPNLNTLIKAQIEENHLAFTTHISSLEGFPYILITVGTPLSAIFDIELNDIKNVMNELSKFKNTNSTVIIKSTKIGRAHV